MIKSAWLTKVSSRDLYSLSIRQEPGTHAMGHNQSDFPPNEKINGKQLSIDEAKELGLTERHHVLGILSIEDLEKLYRAIGKVLYE